MKRVCVFCASRPGSKSSFARAAIDLAEVLCEKKITLVYGGTNVGLMGLLADECLKGGTQVIGVVPKQIAASGIAHPRLTSLKVVENLFERKKMMIELADAFVALPGGVGTYDEIFEIIGLQNLGIIKARLGLLDTERYYNPLQTLLKSSIDHGFWDPKGLGWLDFAENPRDLFKKWGST